MDEYRICGQCWLDGRDNAKISEFRVTLFGAKLYLCDQHRDQLKKAVYRHAEIFGIPPVEFALEYRYRERRLGGLNGTT